MHRYSRTGKHRWTVRALAVLFTALLGLTQWTAPASAHGSVINPATRNYGCWLRWGHDHLNPNMQTRPHVLAGLAGQPNAMWNWNGLYRDGVGRQPPGRPPRRPAVQRRPHRGRPLPLHGRRGPWKTTDVDRTFTIHLYDQASHGADYFLVYVTKQGFDPTTQPLTWGSLELVTRPAATPRPRTTSSRSTPPAAAAATSCSPSGRPRTWTRPTTCAAT